MLWVLELNRRLVGVTRAIGHIEDVVMVETHMKGTLYQRRPGDLLQFKAIRNRKRVRSNRYGLCRVRSQIS